MNKSQINNQMRLIRIKIQSIYIGIKVPKLNELTQCYEQFQKQGEYLFNWLKNHRDDKKGQVQQRVFQYFNKFFTKDQVKKYNQQQIQGSRHIPVQTSRSQKNIQQDDDEYIRKQTGQFKDYNQTGQIINCKLQLKCYQLHKPTNSIGMYKPKQNKILNTSFQQSSDTRHIPQTLSFKKNVDLKLLSRQLKHPKQYLQPGIHVYEHKYKRFSEVNDKISLVIFNQNLRLRQAFIFGVSNESRLQIWINEYFEHQSNKQINEYLQQYYAVFPLKPFSQINHVNHDVKLKMIHKVEGLEGMKELQNNKIIPRIEPLAILSIYSTSTQYWGALRIRKIQLRANSKAQTPIKEQMISLNFQVGSTSFTTAQRTLKQKQQLVWSSKYNFKISSLNHKIKLSYNNVYNYQHITIESVEMDLLQNQMLRQQIGDVLSVYQLKIEMKDYRVRVKFFYKFQMATDQFYNIQQKQQTNIETIQL